MLKRHVLEQVIMCDIYVNSSSTGNIKRRPSVNFMALQIHTQKLLKKTVNKLILGTHVLPGKQTVLIQLILMGMWSRYSAYFLRS